VPKDTEKFLGGANYIKALFLEGDMLPALLSIALFFKQGKRLQHPL